MSHSKHTQLSKDPLNASLDSQTQVCRILWVAGIEWLDSLLTLLMVLTCKFHVFVMQTALKVMDQLNMKMP